MKKIKSSQLGGKHTTSTSIPRPKKMSKLSRLIDYFNKLVLNLERAEHEDYITKKDEFK